MTPISAHTARTLIYHCCLDELGERECAALATSRALDLGVFDLGDFTLIQIGTTWYRDDTA